MKTLINHFISELVITILFTVLLSYLSYDTYKKLKNYSEMSERNSQAVELVDRSHLDERESHQDPELKRMLQQDMNALPLDKIKIVVFIFAYTVLVLLVKGGQNYQSYVGLPSCSAGGYLLVAAHLALSFICAKAYAMKIFER